VSKATCPDISCHLVRSPSMRTTLCEYFIGWVRNCVCGLTFSSKAEPAAALNQPQQCVVVGIGGASRSGKSTLSRLLDAHWRSQGVRCVVIHQDNFFVAEKPITITHNGLCPLSFHNWEVAEAVHFKSMIRVITDAKHQAQSSGEKVYIVVEGFLLYWHPKVVELLDIRLFINIDRSTCYYRRLEANSTWASPEPNFEAYFDSLIWPAYVKQSQNVLSLPSAAITIQFCAKLLTALARLAHIRWGDVKCRIQL